MSGAEVCRRKYFEERSNSTRTSSCKNSEGSMNGEAVHISRRKSRAAARVAKRKISEYRAIEGRQRCTTNHERKKYINGTIVCSVRVKKAV